MLTITGPECSTNVLSSTCVYISRSTEDLGAYSTHRLLKAVRDDDGSQRGLLMLGYGVLVSTVICSYEGIATILLLLLLLLLLPPAEQGWEEGWGRMDYYHPLRLCRLRHWNQA